MRINEQMGQKSAGMRIKVTEGGRVLSEQDFRLGGMGLDFASCGMEKHQRLNETGR